MGGVLGSSGGGCSTRRGLMISGRFQLLAGGSGESRTLKIFAGVRFTGSVGGQAWLRKRLEKFARGPSVPQP